MIPRYEPTYTYSDVLCSLGKSLREDIDENLRSRLATLYKVNHIFILGTAKAALYVLLKAYDRPGDVLMPAYLDIHVPEVVQFAGYNPVFVEIDYKSLNMNVEALRRARSSDTTVILPVHPFGIPWELDEIRRMQLREDTLIIEDAAPAFGAEYRGQLVGGFGDAAIISFHHTKVVSAEMGGALLTNNDELAQKVDRLLQEAVTPENDWRLFIKAIARKILTSSWVYSGSLFAYRILRDERMYQIATPRTEMPTDLFTLCPHFCTALISIQLDRLEWNLGRRRKLAQIYQNGLADFSELTLPIIPQNCSPAWIQFPILVNDKGAFYKYMKRYGIDLSWTWRYSCADSFGLDGFPNAQKVAKTLLGLPTYPSLTDDNAQYICDVTRKYLRGM